MLLFSFSSFQNIYQNIYCSSTLLLLIFPKGIGKHIESQNEKTILFTAVYLIRD